MFELIERERRAAGRKASTLVLSIAVHVVILGALIVVPLLYVSSDLPTPREVITAFAAAPPAAPPPPPPPPPAAAAAPQPKDSATQSAAPLAPVEAPREINLNPAPPAPVGTAGTGGVPGGVIGGIAGGVVGGTVGGLPDAPPAQTPVRVGGQIKAPGLTQRVDPEYPALARQARTQGIVVLEATVGTDGRVQDVRVLRGSALLNDAAIKAVRQWRYTPLVLNGQPTPFILTVTVTFKLE